MHAVDRARLHHHRQRHRAHRVADHGRRRRHQDLLPPGRQDRGRDRAGRPPSRRRSCARMPPGSPPPLIMRYSASSVPILQLALASDTLPEPELFDYAQNFVRTQLATVRGASVRLPYGGKQRQIMVDLDPRALYATGLVAARRGQRDQRPEPDPAHRHRQDRRHASTASAQQQPRQRRAASTICRSRPSTARPSTSATSPTCATASRRRPTSCASGGRGPPGHDPQERQRLDARRRAAHQGHAARRSRPPLPPELEDRAAVRPVDLRAGRRRRRGAARRSSPRASPRSMILLFLGQLAQHADRGRLDSALDPRRSIIVLGCLGQTLNVMTLGGLALAVGILVDDATVEIENIHRNLGHGQAAAARRSSTARSRSRCRRSSRRSASASCSCRSCS